MVMHSICTCKHSFTAIARMTVVEVFKDRGKKGPKKPMWRSELFSLLNQN